MRFFFYFILILISFCTTTKFIQEEKQEATPEWGPAEISATAEYMVKSVQEYFDRSKEKPYIELAKIHNRSSEHIETGMLTNSIVTNLLQRKIIFVDRRERADAIKEIELGQKGIVKSDSQLPVGELLSPNFKLSGEITDNLRYVEGDKVQYIVVTLRLLKLSTGSIEWQEEKKFLKISKRQRVGW
jgi:PBP1b-binding outer membrane lipoprotein LpoB